MQIIGFIGMHILWWATQNQWWTPRDNGDHTYALIAIMLAFLALLLIATAKSSAREWVKIAIVCGTLISLVLSLIAMVIIDLYMWGRPW